MFSTKGCFLFEIEKFISIPNNSSVRINSIKMVHINWEMWNFTLHYFLTLWSYLSWIDTLFVNFEAIIICFFIWAIRNFAFTINVIIIENLESCGDNWWITHAESKTLNIINHRHILINDFSPCVITKSSLLPAFISNKRWSLIACLCLISCCISV